MVRSVGIASLALMALVGTFVAARLVLVARRTRGLPELAMGLGLLLVTVLGGPLAAVSRLPTMVGTAPGDLLFDGGMLVILLGIGCIYVFTWRVFRSGSSWAQALMGAAAVALGAVWLGLVHANGQAETLEEVLPHTRPWGIAVVALNGSAFLWTALESLGYYGMLRRRLALGMSDALVVNRFFLWAVASFAATALSAVIAGTMLAGGAPVNDPVPLVCIGSASIAVSAAWYLAFFPPEPFVRFIRRRAAAGTTPV